MNKTLIAYFSASGETGKLAKTLSAVTGGDLFEIRPETAYTSAGAVRHRVRRLPDLVVSGAAHHRNVS